MTTNDEQYVLSVDEVRAAWVDREFEFGDTTDRASVDFDRFLARVRRDAAREALDGLAIDLAVTSGYTEAEEVRDYRDAHYPEEAPATEQQADQQEVELDSWMTRAYEAEGKLWKAEARIKAVQDALDGYGKPTDRIGGLPDAIRRALDGAK